MRVEPIHNEFFKEPCMGDVLQNKTGRRIDIRVYESCRLWCWAPSLADWRRRDVGDHHISCDQIFVVQPASRAPVGKPVSVPEGWTRFGDKRPKHEQWVWLSREKDPEQYKSAYPWGDGILWAPCEKPSLK